MKTSTHCRASATRRKRGRGRPSRKRHAAPDSRGPHSAPGDGRTITVLTTSGGQYIEHPDVAVQSLRTPDECGSGALRAPVDAPWGEGREALDAAATALGLVRTNVFFDPIRTADLRVAAAEAVAARRRIRKGRSSSSRRPASAQARAYQALQETRMPHTGSVRLAPSSACCSRSAFCIWAKTLSSRFHARARYTVYRSEPDCRDGCVRASLYPAQRCGMKFVAYQAQAESDGAYRGSGRC